MEIWSLICVFGKIVIYQYLLSLTLRLYVMVSLLLLEAFANFGTPPYSYQWDQNLSPDQYQTVSPNVNTNYNVTVTDINNCSDTGTITIIVNALPIVTAFANTPVCEGFGTILFGNGGTYYNWAGPNNFNSTQQNALVEGLPQNSGTYFSQLLKTMAAVVHLLSIY